MKRKIVTFLFLLIMVFTVGCNKDKKNDPTPTPTTEPDTPTPTPEPAPEPTPEYTEEIMPKPGAGPVLPLTGVERRPMWVLLGFGCALVAAGVLQLCVRRRSHE